MPKPRGPLESTDSLLLGSCQSQEVIYNQWLGGFVQILHKAKKSFAISGGLAM
jgi:hypothetical protein